MTGERQGAKRRRQAGRTDGEMSRRERRLLLRLVVSAAVLLLAVGMKIAAPELMLQLRERFLQAVSAEMDMQEVFSAFGKAVSGEGTARERWQEVYRSVFAPGETAETAAPMAELSEDGAALAALPCYSAENTPRSVRLTQEVLGMDYTAPLEGELTSGFGLRGSPADGQEEFHYGLDLAAEEGTAIVCFADGLVRAAGDSSSLGHYLIVDHAGGYATLYAHCSRLCAAAGDEVALGETVAEVGQSGNATGPHLHFELLRGGDYLNPVYYL